MTNQYLKDIANVLAPMFLQERIDELSAKINADLMGDGAGTCITLSSAEGVVNNEPLTFNKMKELIADFPPALPGPVRLIEVAPYPIYGPARRHRKRRIQKKWLKRYGTTVVGYDYPMGDNVLVDEKRGVAYCHPHVTRQIRSRTTQQVATWPK